jgi:hypothetical protein
MNRESLTPPKTLVKSIFSFGAGVVCSFLCLINFYNVEYHGLDSGITLLVGTFLLCVIFLLIRSTSSWTSRHRFITLAIVPLFTFGFRLLFVLAVQTEPISDFAVSYNTAMDFLEEGSAVYTKVQYFVDYPFMIFYSLYQALILWAFPSLWALKVMNLLWIAGSALLICLIGERVYHLTAGLFAGLLYAIFPELIFFTPVLSNQIPATFFFLLAVYLLFRKKQQNWPIYLLAGISMALSNLFRPEAITLLTALLITGGVYFFQAWREKKLTRPLLLESGKKLLALLLVYFSLQGAVSAGIQAIGASETGLKSQVTDWKFMCGLSVQSGGAYLSKENFPDYSAAETDAERQAAAHRYIQNNIDTILETGRPLRFFQRKCENMWTGVVYNEWSCSHLDKEKLLLGEDYTMQKFLSNMNTLNTLFSFALWGFSAVGIYIACRRRIFNVPHFFCSTLVLVTFGVYCLIEYQTRYRYNLMAFTVILAAGIITQLIPPEENHRERTDIR